MLSRKNAICSIAAFSLLLSHLWLCAAFTATHGDSKTVLYGGLVTPPHSRYFFKAGGHSSFMVSVTAIFRIRFAGA